MKNNKTIDLTGLFNQVDFKVETVLTASFKLSKEQILTALSSDSIYINGRMYKTPQMRLLECLRQVILYNTPPDMFTLELIEIKNEKANTN